MKRLAPLFLGLFFVACSNNSSDSSNAVSADGPTVEVNVTSFDIEKRKTEIELINRSEENIVDIKGRLLFLGEDGSPLTTATGRPLDSPFQKQQKPAIVKSMNATTISLSNKLPEETASIQLEDIKVTFDSGDSFDIEDKVILDKVLMH